MDQCLALEYCNKSLGFINCRTYRDELRRGSFSARMLPHGVSYFGFHYHSQVGKQTLVRHVAPLQSLCLKLLQFLPR
jgi:hypothetical protein